MEHTNSANSVSLQPQGYILVKLVGKQDFLSMDEVAKQCKELTDQIRMQRKPILGLVDFSQDQGFSTGTNKAVMRALEEIEYDRIAMFGTNAVLGEVTKTVIAALGKADRTKVFGTREEALAWLLMRDPVHGYGN
ncbi:MAG TPA: STAS/SEC14 domain-containing protein [Candidatus Saccharimonadia bacterium]|jgi:hypothetical protein